MGERPPHLRPPPPRGSAASDQFHPTLGLDRRDHDLRPHGGAAATDLKTSVASLKSQIAMQTLIGNQQIANLESQFTNAINNTSGASATLSYLSILSGSGSTTKG